MRVVKCNLEVAPLEGENRGKCCFEEDSFISHTHHKRLGGDLRWVKIETTILPFNVFPKASFVGGVW